MKIADIENIDLKEEFGLLYEGIKHFYPSVSDNNVIHLLGNQPKHEPDTLFSILLFIKLQMKDILISEHSEEIYYKFLDTFAESRIIPIDGDIYSPTETLNRLGLYPDKKILGPYIGQLSKVTPPILDYIRKELSGDSDGLFLDIKPYLYFTEMFKPHLNDFMVKLTARIMEFSVHLRTQG